MEYILSGLWKGVEVEIMRLHMKHQDGCNFESIMITEFDRKDTPTSGDLIIRSYDNDFNLCIAGHKGGRLMQLFNLPHHEWTQEKIRTLYLLEIRGNRLGYTK